MSKCRYDLSEDCNNKDCVKCVLDKIRAEILKLDDADYDFEGYYKAVTDALAIIDKYRGEEDETDN